MNNVATWPATAENWLDERGKGAWIAAMVLSFIFVWPLGLALFAYMIWSKRMFAKSCHHTSISHNRNRWLGRRHGFHSSGNVAFDSYKADMLQRLLDEQKSFETFLERLRAAKDKSEFDDFMDERAQTAKDARTKPADDSTDDNTEDTNKA